MGARGNSGVILSQLLRGMGERMAGAGDEAAWAPTSWSDAIGHAVRAGPPGRGAPGGGDDPHRGRGGGRATGAAQGSDLVGVVERARARRADALARTPEMLPVLAQAGVVDAGRRRLPPPARRLPPRARRPAAARAVRRGGPGPQRRSTASGRRRPGHEAVDGEHAVGDLRYEVMYLLERARRLH